jgi:hypothetical protein
MINKYLQTAIMALSFSIVFAPAPAITSAQDIRNRTFKDDLLDNLVGEWKLVRRMQGRITENVVKADWVLNHQFLRIQMRDIADPPAYEATVFIGYDTMQDRYVVHWLDVFGGRSSQTIGHGSRNGNSMKFLFPYPEHPFVNTFTWNPEMKTWNFLMQQKNPDKSWTVFGEDNLSRIAPAK